MDKSLPGVLSLASTVIINNQAHITTYLKLRLRPEVLHQVGRNSPLMAVRFVVEVEHMGLRVELRRVRAIILDCINMREGLHPKLAVESTAKRVKNLIFFLGTVPY